MRTARSSRRGGAQAVLETALVIPVLLLLVCNFAAVMVQVAAQEQLDSAVSLAAQSRFQATQEAFDPPGTRCCPDPRCCARASDATSLDTGGLPTGCRYAAESFYGTMTFNERLLRWNTAPLCMTGGDSGSGGGVAHAAAAYPGAPESHVSCDVGSVGAAGAVFPGFLDRMLNPPFGLRVVTCDASAVLDFSRTPLGWGVFWSPSLHAHAEVVPPPFRQ
jgi:hypothetical protein